MFGALAEWSRIDTEIADQKKGDFVRSISHELRSPLHGILASAEFLEEVTGHLQGRKQDPAQLCWYLDIIHSDGLQVSTNAEPNAHGDPVAASIVASAYGASDAHG